MTARSGPSVSLEDVRATSGSGASPNGPATPPGPLTFGQKILYGFGEGGEAVKNTALQTFLLFYYVQVLGLSGSLCGIAMLLALALDGAIDPLVGTWSDHVRSRLGRRHPFLYAAPVPLAICLFALFNPPAGWGAGALFAWLLGFNLLSRIAMTLYYVPHMALGAELSENFHDRLAVGAYRMFFTQVGGLACLSAAFTIFFVPDALHANGQLNAAAYRPFSIFCGALVVLFVLVSAIGTQKRAIEVGRRRPHAPTNEGLTPRGLLKNFRNALAVANFRRCFLALLIMYLFAGTQNVLALHMNNYFWGFTPQQAQFIFYAQIAGFLLGLPFSRAVAGRLDKKRAYFMCVGGSCTLLSMPIILRLLGWFPENGDPLVLGIVTAANITYGFLGATSVVCSTAMLADTADEYEFRYGARVEGLFFGAVSFSSKASIGVGAALAGSVLDIIHFPRPPIQAAPTAAALWQLGFVYGPVLLGLLFTGLSFMLRFDLDRASHEAMVVELRRRREHVAAADPQSATILDIGAQGPGLTVSTNG